MKARQPSLLLGAFVAVLSASATLGLAQEAISPVLPDVNLSGIEPAVAAQLSTLRDQAIQTAHDKNRSATAQALAELARHYHAYDFFSAATSTYRSSLELAEQDTARYLLALALRKTGELEDAAQLFGEVAKRQPNYGAAWYWQAQTLLDLGRFSEAQSALPNQDRSAAALALRGRLAMEHRDFEAAASLFEAALTKEPAANRIYYPLAQAYRALGQPQRAAEALGKLGPVGSRPADPLYQEVLELKVGSLPQALAARTAFQAGRFREAADLFRKALVAAPESSSLKVNLAAALAQAGQVQEAVELLESALALNPDSAAATFNLGVLLAGQGQVHRAAVRLERAVALRPEDTEARSEWVRALHKLGRTKDALQALSPLSSTPRYDESMRLLEIELLLDAARYDSLVDRLGAALAALPESGLVAHAAARFFAAGPSRSHRDGRRALELSQRVFAATGDPGHAFTVALAYGELQRCEEARRFIAVARQGIKERGQQPNSQLEALDQKAASGDCRP